jgi:HlyD family secretion protein
MKKAVRVALLIAVMAVLAGAGYWYHDSRAAAADTSDTTLTQVVTAQQGDLTATLSVVGSLEAVESADLAFSDMSGTAALQSLDVQAGQVVTAGQVLATIDPASYQQTLDQAKSDLESAEQALADLTAAPSDLEIAQADVAVAAAQVDVQAAADSLDELENPDLADLQAAVTNARVALAQSKVDLLALQQQDTSDELQIDELSQAYADANAVYTDYANKVHSDSDRGYFLGLTLAQNKMKDAQDALVTAQVNAKLSLLQAQIAVTDNEQTLTEAQQALADAKAGGDPLELTQAKESLQEAKVSLEAAQESRTDLEAGPDASDVAAAQAEVDRAKLAVSDAEAALADTQLVAPFDGTVLDVNVNEGDPIDSSTSIVTVANLDSFEVVAAVDETTIRQVSQGQKATITFDAHPGQTFQGEVLSVPLQGTLQGDVTVYDVPLSLEGANGLNLLVGMTANVEIQVGEVSDAVLVPTMALQRANGGYVVEVPNTSDPSGEPETVPVQIGLSNGTYTQIVKGLNVGDKVIVPLDTSSSNSNNSQFGGGDGNPPVMPNGGTRP